MPAASEAFREQLESLYSISVDIARLRELPQVLDQSLSYCLELTASEFGFVGLLNGSEMDVVAIKGFQPLDPTFLERFNRIPIRPSLFSEVVKEGRPTISDDVPSDSRRVGQPPGHPSTRTYLGVPLKVGEQIIGMIGVANKSPRYTPDDQRLLTTFANQAAVAIENARLNERQRDLIARQVQHEERERIAAELHDRIEQAIFSMGLSLSTILEKDELPSAVGERLRDVRRQAAETAQQLRDVVFALSTSRSGAGELAAALRQLLKEAGSRHNLDSDLVLTGPAVQLDTRLEEVLQSVTREALVNTARHARARMVMVGLNSSSDHVDLVIQDDGEGAPELLLENITESATHFGLNSMRRQVEAAGGTFRAANGDGGGFTVKVRLPTGS
jgi:signal transduction histidine kinase